MFGNNANARHGKDFLLDIVLSLPDWKFSYAQKLTEKKDDARQDN
jgi:hypothetical protein